MKIKNIIGSKFGDGIVTQFKRLESLETENSGEIYKIDFEISYGGQSHINNTMLIPEKWNGRFVGIGNGGIAGILGTEWYRFAQNGYIGAQSDLGTSADAQ